ncbi:hypothetical protein NC652_015494 [Populus alba x Populus x berolinensis]|nr:hypothetical protein NC652_015494 [Populus alba x Populus x berolinensis]
MYSPYLHRLIGSKHTQNHGRNGPIQNACTNYVLLLQQVTTMVIKVVDLGCEKCHKKIKRVLCAIPQIQNQTYDQKKNTVTITVVGCCPEKIKKKIYCKGGECVKCIEIPPPPSPPCLPPPLPPPPPPCTCCEKCRRGPCCHQCCMPTPPAKCHSVIEGQSVMYLHLHVYHLHVHLHVYHLHLHVHLHVYHLHVHLHVYHLHLHHHHAHVVKNAAEDHVVITFVCQHLLQNVMYLVQGQSVIYGEMVVVVAEVEVTMCAEVYMFVKSTIPRRHAQSCNGKVQKTDGLSQRPASTVGFKSSERTSFERTLAKMVFL